MRTAARTYPHTVSGSKIHVVYDVKSKVVQLCVWETESGRLVALERNWLAEYQDEDIDPVPDLLKVYGNLEDEGDD
jgi:hypothetical protein